MLGCIQVIQSRPSAAAQSGGAIGERGHVEMLSFPPFSRSPVSVTMSLKRISPAPIYAPAIRTHKFDQCRANQCRLAVARNARHYLRVPGLDVVRAMRCLKTGRSGSEFTRHSRGTSEVIFITRNCRGELVDSKDDVGARDRLDHRRIV